MASGLDDDRPAFGFRDRRTFDDANGITGLEFVLRVVRPVFLGLTNGLLQQRVLEAALDENGDGLLVLVRGHDTLQDTLWHLSVLLFRSFSGFGVQHRLDAGNILADGAHAGGVFQLVGRLLKAQIERDLNELENMYISLKSDLKDNISNKEVIEAMIENNRNRMKLVDDVLEQINC